MENSIALSFKEIKLITSNTSKYSTLGFSLTYLPTICQILRGRFQNFADYQARRQPPRNDGLAQSFSLATTREKKSLIPQTNLFKFCFVQTGSCRKRPLYSFFKTFTCVEYGNLNRILNVFNTAAKRSKKTLAHQLDLLRFSGFCILQLPLSKVFIMYLLNLFHVCF